MMQAEIDEQPHFVLLKLNYKESYIHFLQNGEEEKRAAEAEKARQEALKAKEEAKKKLSAALDKVEKLAD